MAYIAGNPTFDFNGVVQQDGSLAMTGTISNLGPTTIIVNSQDLPVQGLKKCDPQFTVNGARESFANNDAACAALRDMLSAFNLGFVGSTVTNPNTGKPLGDGPSNTWEGIDKKLAFAGAQPSNPTYYNQYAGYLLGVSDAYGFPFTDFVHKPLLSLHPSKVKTMTIAVQAD